jgi:hypothetical protein
LTSNTINAYKDSGCLSSSLSPNLGSAGGDLIASIAKNVTESDANKRLTVNFDSQVTIEPGEAIRVEIQMLDDGSLANPSFTFAAGSYSTE